MRFIISAVLLIVGIIHLLPLSGALSLKRLQMLYGIAIVEPSLEILMRHRAVLFGLLGAFLVAAAFFPSLQLTALAAGFVSVASFSTCQKLLEVLTSTSIGLSLLTRRHLFVLSSG